MPNLSIKLKALGWLAILFAGLGILAACAHWGVADQVKSPFLWSVAKDGRTHYLLGTIHVGVDAESELPESVWSRFRDSDCLVMESDTSSIDAQELMTMGELPDGKLLKDQISPKAYRELQDRVGGKVPRRTLERAQPWFAAALFIQTLAPPGRGMDETFAHFARDADRRLEFLEDWRDVMGAFARATTARDLEDMALNGDASAKHTDDLIAAYRTGDERQLMRIEDQITAETPDGEAKLKIMLDERNAKWVPRLTRALGKGRCFVVVGVGHLYRKGNVRDLLTERGFEVKRLD